MASLRADRRLYVNADRSLIVDEGDVRGSWLLAAKGRVIGEGDVVKYRLSVRNGRVAWPALLKQAAPAEDKQAAKPEDKAAAKPERRRPVKRRSRKGKLAALARESVDG